MTDKLPYAEVIGDPIAHSKSPLIHNFWLDCLGIEAEYKKTHVTAEALSAYFLERRADPDWLGSGNRSVTFLPVTSKRFAGMMLAGKGSRKVWPFTVVLVAGSYN